MIAALIALSLAAAPAKHHKPRPDFTVEIMQDDLDSPTLHCVWSEDHSALQCVDGREYVEMYYQNRKASEAKAELLKQHSRDL